MTTLGLLMQYTSVTDRHLTTASTALTHSVAR